MNNTEAAPQVSIEELAKNNPKISLLDAEKIEEAIRNARRTGLVQRRQYQLASPFSRREHATVARRYAGPITNCDS